MNNILIIDDQDLIVSVVKELLLPEGYIVFSANKYKDALDLLDKEDIHLVFLDVNMPDIDGISLLKLIKEKHSSVPVVMLTADSSLGTAVSAIKFGAEDYITKDSIRNRLLPAAKNILKSQNLSREVDGLKTYLNDSLYSDKIIYKSEIMCETLALADKAASSEITVLISGESGTGKELISRHIHFKSKRAAKPLIAIDCAMLPENLVESELFGYERGAFTGAVARKPGRIELANDGTLFLDEIGNLSTDVQKKMLRFLEQKTIERIGGKTSSKINVRLITASNANLPDAVKDGKFREDLFYRLNVFTIKIPPLRDRKEDIPILTNYFLERFSKENQKRIPSISKEVTKVLEQYDWPGNIRELRNVMERASLLAEDEIRMSHISVETNDEKSVSIPFVSGESLLNVGKKAAMDAEKRYIVKVLEETSGNKLKASKILKIDYKTLFNKLKEYGISLLFLITALSGYSADKPGLVMMDGFPFDSESQFVYSSPVVCDLFKTGAPIIVSAAVNKILVLDTSGKVLTGWPFLFSVKERCESSPVVKDVDGDGVNEILALTKSGPDLFSLYIFGPNGKLISGYPKSFKGMIDYGASLAAEDLDGDGISEILIAVSVTTLNGMNISGNAANAAFLYVLKLDGSSMQGWPQIVIPDNGSSQWLSTPVVSDINGDGKKEIISASITGKVFVWGTGGFILKGWPVSAAEGDVFYIKPTVFDIDNDGKAEILIGSCNNAQSGSVYVWNHKGTLIPGFPVNLKSNVQPEIACVLEGGVSRIAAGTNLGSKLWVLESDGTASKGFPVETKNWLCNHPVFADLGGSGSNEVIIGCREPFIYIFKTDGSNFPGSPFELTGEPFIIYKKPALFKDASKDVLICYNADKKIFLWKTVKNN